MTDSPQIRSVASSLIMANINLKLLGLLVLSIASGVLCEPDDADTDCPTWRIPIDSSPNKTQVCKCGNSIGGVVHCDPGNVSLLMGYCMTYDEEEGMAYLAACPFGVRDESEMYSLLPQNVSKLNDFTCSPYNREGIVCSECKTGYGPSVFTQNLECFKCSGLYYGWSLYIFFELFPITILFIIMSLLHIRLTSSGFNCLLFHTQMIVAVLSYGAHIGVFPFGSTSGILHKILLTLYGILNLDFFRQVIPPFCVSENINGLHSIAMQYLGVLYLLVLTLSVFVVREMHYRGCGVTMWLWRNLFVRLIRVRQNWTFKTTLADSLATFLLLSYTRLMLVSFNLLYPVPVYNEYGATKITLNFQQNIGYLSKEHLPYAFLAIVVLILLVVLPPLLFLVYPMKCSQRSCIQYPCIKAGLTQFVELFQGCFKDGTENTRDFRWFSIFYFALRFAMFVTHMVGYGGRPKTSFLLPAIVLLGASLTILLLRPYKRNLYNAVDGVMLACSSVMCFLQSVMVLIPDTTEGKVLQITLQIGLFLPILFLIFYSMYLCIKFSQSKLKLSREVSESCESLPDRLLHPETYDTCHQALLTESFNSGSTYGSLVSKNSTE